MAAVTPINLAMAVGASGAFVDVTSYLTGTKTINATWGQTDPFRDVEAGTFTFTLDNFDGRFTPGNVLSPLATPIQEGTAVCWQAGSRLMSGSILNFAFPNSADERGRITITCDDILGDLARYQMPTTGFMAQLEAPATPLLLWLMNEDNKASSATETTGTNAVLAPNTGQYYYNSGTQYFVQTATFGVTQSASFLGQTGMSITPGTQRNGVPATGDYGSMIADVTGLTNFTYPIANGGYWGFWCDQVWADDKDPAYQACVQVTFSSNNAYPLTYYPYPNVPQLPFDAPTVSIFPSSVVLGGSPGSASSPLTVPLTPGPHYYAVKIFAPTITSGYYPISATLYVDGVSQGTVNYAISAAAFGNWNPQPSIVAVNVFGQAGATISRLGHFATLPHPELANVTTVADKLTFYDAAISSIPAATVSGTLSTAPIGQTIQTGTALEALQAMMRTEQGYLYPVTTGTVTSPTVTLTMRSRTRALTPKISFDAVTEIEGVLPFERHITNLVATSTANGDGTSATLTDSSVSARAQNSSSSDAVLFSKYADALLWASDRINRGKILTPYPTTITIDSQTTPTDRSADLLALVPGDRVSITNINSKITGFSTWDGWLLGATESHTPFSDVWTLYLAPVTEQAFYDTSLFQPDGLSLFSAINASVTGFQIVSTNTALTLSDSAVLPVTIQVDQEQMTVTGCAPGTPNANLSVTRGVNGTTAAAHAANATVTLLPNSLYAF